MLLSWISGNAKLLSWLSMYVSLIIEGEEGGSMGERYDGKGLGDEVGVVWLEGVEGCIRGGV